MPKSKCNKVKIQVQVIHFYFYSKKKKMLRHFHDSLLIKKKKVDIFTQKGTGHIFFLYIAWTGQKFFCFFLLVGLDWIEYLEPQIKECSKP